MDIFKEQIVQKKPTSKDAILRVLLIVGVVAISVITFSIVPAFAFVITAAAAIGAFFLMGLLKIEYEYVFTNGEMDIDIIYNRSRRKRLITVDVKSFELMAHVEDKTHIGGFNSAQETKDFSSGVVGENTYAFLISKNGKRLKVIFEPNERMISAISSSMSRSKLHIKR